VLGLAACLGPPPPGDEPRACFDGEDNDGDAEIDFPFDPGCESELDPQESDPFVPRACSDAIDNDRDGRIDFDRNGNGMIDLEDDPGCESAADDDEANVVLPECADLLDNDSDGRIDLDDPQCPNRNDVSEAE
jgi:hypothetical protein